MQMIQVIDYMDVSRTPGYRYYPVEPERRDRRDLYRPDVVSVFHHIYDMSVHVPYKCVEAMPDPDVDW